jgi:hypothetical protein
MRNQSWLLGIIPANAINLNCQAWATWKNQTCGNGGWLDNWNGFHQSEMKHELKHPGQIVRSLIKHRL